MRGCGIDSEETRFLRTARRLLVSCRVVSSGEPSPPRPPAAAPALPSIPPVIVDRVMSPKSGSSGPPTRFGSAPPLPPAVKTNEGHSHIRCKRRQRTG